ncbi:allophanate hydrolase [Sinomonas atrocyanea]|uniref:Allophanate hydrolase n=1 Tax=Sinomonas atrocyanea TaxID=37927 RepID=A0A127A0C5_9MICC|nr:carboxyltransferase domain-containing protein [Sinomonas atrocyanea]AMM32783.1 allophanate hydrolase [Sinomonas atrocyanea]GEB66441.1 allophanate hydrolase [Sinomonas atrocyanea]GGG72562.1 allophanate hydrolase [Sinomonas atrocyanea]
MGALVPSPVEVFESGDAALRVVATSGDVERDWSTVHRLAGWLETCGAEGLHGAVPTYDSVLVEFDVLVVSAAQMRAFVGLGMRQLALSAAGGAPRTFDVPVVYGGDYGPDLDDVAEQQGITADEVVRLHSSKAYTIRCLGAPAGSPMMDGPDFPHPVPRLKDPRLSVPAGAVAVAGRQAVIAPAVAPGGWRVIGQTPLTLLDAGRDPLVPYRPGDTIRFRPVAERDFDALAGTLMEAQP